VWDLLKYWREFPPTHVLLRGFVGWRGPEEEEGELQMPAELAGAPVMKTLPPHLTQHLEDLKELQARKGKKNARSK